MDQFFALIIDDDENNVTVLANLLSRQNIKSSKIFHPNQLGAMLESIEPVDVVFLDLEMPGRDGFEVFELLTGDDRFQDTPIVAYTVHVSKKTDTYQHGFHGFLGKPLDPDRFPDQIARILNGEQVWE